MRSLILAWCFFPHLQAIGAEGDYFYSSGRRRELKKLENRWAVRCPVKIKDGNGWGRHGISLASSAAEARAMSRRVARSFVNPVFDYGSGRPLVVTDEFIVCFHPGMNRGEIEEINSSRGVSIVRGLAHPPNSFLLSAEGGGELSALRLANEYVEKGYAVFAHPNFIARKMKKAVPGDPYFPMQWHLLSAGQGGALPYQDVEACPAWDITRGDPRAVIAVIDDGVDLSHEDLQGDKFVPGYDFYDGDGDPSAVAMNEDFHGTAVTGIIGANGDNGLGVTGVAPGCRIMPIRLVCGETTDEQDAGAIRWAAENGAWVISNSWGPPDGNPFITGDEAVYPLPDIVKSAIDYAADNGRGGKGCVICWAAGNGSEPLGNDGYASYGKVMSVGACNDQGRRSYYSDYGPELDVCAPSDGGRTPGIWTTDLSGAAGYNEGKANQGDPAGNYFNGFGGTSAAAPLVSGIAALILSVEPELTGGEVVEKIRGTADRADFRHALYDLSGHSGLYGYGRANAYSALTGRPRYPQLRLSTSPDSLKRGEALSLSYLMQGGRLPISAPASIYLLVISPGGNSRFVAPGFVLTREALPFIPAFVPSDMSGSLPPLSMNSSTEGRYTIYSAIVPERTNPLLRSSWVHNPASADFDIIQ